MLRCAELAYSTVYVVTCHQNCPRKTVLMRFHNIYVLMHKFGKLFLNYLVMHSYLENWLDLPVLKLGKPVSWERDV